MDKKTEKPYCYEPNKDPYPLCKGQIGKKAITIMPCKQCNLYENMEESPYYT